MRGGPVRLGQLSRLLPEASKKVLMTELKQLVRSGLVERRDLSDGGVVGQTV
jgi:DNA-binding HxlR family transcriptional regulator